MFLKNEVAEIVKNKIPLYNNVDFVSLNDTLLNPKINQISEMVQAQQNNIYIEVDGGIDKNTAPLVVNAGANVLVAGTAVFETDDIKEAIREIRDSVNPLKK